MSVEKIFFIWPGFFFFLFGNIRAVPRAYTVFYFYVPTGEENFVYDQYGKFDVPGESVVAREEMHQ